MTVDPLTVKIIISFLFGTIGIVAYFVKKLIDLVYKMEATLEKLNVTMQQQKTSCPLIHKEIDRRLDILETKLK